MTDEKTVLCIKLLLNACTFLSFVAQGRFIDVLEILPTFEPEDKQLDQTQALIAKVEDTVIHKAALTDRFVCFFMLATTYCFFYYLRRLFAAPSILFCRINELCEEIFEAKHFAQSNNNNSSSSMPFARRLLLQSLPLKNPTLKAHILAHVLQEQAELTATLRSDSEVSPNIDTIDTFRQETSREIQQSCDQMADAILARALIETVAELGRHYDLAKLFL